jgi:hypothetical protein
LALQVITTAALKLLTAFLQAVYMTSSSGKKTNSVQVILSEVVVVLVVTTVFTYLSSMLVGTTSVSGVADPP